MLRFFYHSCNLTILIRYNAIIFSNLFWVFFFFCYKKSVYIFFIYVIINDVFKFF